MCYVYSIDILSDTLGIEIIYGMAKICPNESFWALIINWVLCDVELLAHPMIRFCEFLKFKAARVYRVAVEEEWKFLFPKRGLFQVSEDDDPSKEMTDEVINQLSVVQNLTLEQWE